MPNLKKRRRNKTKHNECANILPTFLGEELIIKEL